MDVENQPGRRFKGIDVFGDQDTVAAQVNIPVPGNQFRGYGVDVRMQQGFAAGDRNHRRTAFQGRPDTIANLQAGTRCQRGLPAFAAPRTVQVADKKRFQHQNEGKFASTFKQLAKNIKKNGRALFDRYAQIQPPANTPNVAEATIHRLCLNVEKTPPPRIYFYLEFKSFSPVRLPTGGKE
jgi:hypothetical protein